MHLRHGPRIVEFLKGMALSQAESINELETRLVTVVYVNRHPENVADVLEGMSSPDADAAEVVVGHGVLNLSIEVRSQDETAGAASFPDRPLEVVQESLTSSHFTPRVPHNLTSAKPFVLGSRPRCPTALGALELLRFLRPFEWPLVATELAEASVNLAFLGHQRRAMALGLINERRFG